MPDLKFPGLLGEWAKGCSAETLDVIRRWPTDSSVMAVNDMLVIAWHTADRLGQFSAVFLCADLNRLRTLILRRLDGAERAKKRATELAADINPDANLTPQERAYVEGVRQAGREVLELLDA